MRKAIVTFGTGKHREMLDIAFPSFQTFAERHGWDIYRADKIGTARPPAWYKIQALLELLPDYDEVLWLGADTVIVDGRDDLTAPPEYWQALVKHHTIDGEVPNTDVWLCRKPMIPILEQVWGMTQWLMHGWWEQAALLELMGYTVYAPSRVLGNQTELYNKTYFLDNGWNVHKWDIPQPEHPRIQHATMYPDRVKIMWEWAMFALNDWMKPGWSEDERIKSHRWQFATGIRDENGNTSIPCIDCGAELRANEKNGLCTIIAGGFKNDMELQFCDRDGLEWILLREIETGYKPQNIVWQNHKAIDIGAHVGIVSMYLAKKYGVTVYAYEPSPHNYERLLKNIEANGLMGKIIPHNVAVTGDGRKVTISNGGLNSGGYNIYSGGDEISSVTLSDILAEVGDVDLLKIDCEGAEYEILATPEILRGKVRAIRGEFHFSRGDAKDLTYQVSKVVPDIHISEHRE